MLIVVLMTVTVLGSVHFPSPSASTAPSFSSQPLANVSDPLASVGVSATYYTLASESNSVYGFSVPFSENSSYTQIAAFSSSSAWTESSNKVAGWTQSFGSMYFGMFSDTTNVELDQIAFNIGQATYLPTNAPDENLGTLYANLTSPMDVTYTWSHTFNYVNTGETVYAYLDPQWTVYDSPYTIQIGTWSVQFTDVLETNYVWATAPSGMASNTGSQTNSFQTSVTGSNTAINGVIGTSYGTQDCYFTIPANEASYKIVFSNPSVPQIYSEYAGDGAILDSTATTTAGILSGSYINEMFGNVNGDPNPGGSGTVATTASSVTYTITLENQEQAVLNNVGSYFSGSVAYSPSNPSPNEFTYAVPFSFSTPSGAYFGTYESGTNSFLTDSATFSPSVTVIDLEQVDYTCSQAGFFISLNNGSYSQQSNAQDHSYTYSNTYTSAQTIDNYIQTISVANTAPKYVSSYMEFMGTGSEMKLYFNISQPVFTGESESVSIVWGDGTVSNTLGTTYSQVFTHSYAKTGTFTITASFSNVPSVSEGVLSSLSGPTQIYTWQVAINPVITPVYGSELTAGEPVTMHFTAIHDIVGTVTAYDSGTDFQSHTFNTASGSMTMYPPSAGLTGFTLLITFDGAFYSVSYQYSSPLYPSYNSTFIVEIGGESLTQQYPITITNSGTSASGNFVYNFTESSTYWSPYVNPPLSNVLFRYANGTLIQADLVTHDSTSATWYLSLYSIPSTGTASILQIFYPSGEGVFINTTLSLTSYSSISQSIGAHENSTIVNSTNISYVPYSTTGKYYPNPLLQAFTYFIPDYFNERYIQVNWNASWISSVYSPSYKGSVYPYAAETLFSNVTNVGEVSVVYNQPSTQLGQSVFVDASLYSNGLPIQSGYTSQFYMGVEYTQFDQSTVNYANESSMYFELPMFGANATFTVYDAWGQVVGIVSGVIVTAGTIDLSVNLQVTQVGIRVINTTLSSIEVSANNVYQNISTYQDFYFLNDSSLTWYASVFDLSLGQNVNYSGIFHPKGFASTLYVNVTAPLATLVVNAESYVSSYVGPLSSKPPDNVTLLLNGIEYQLGQQAAFFVGNTVNIRILDVTGDVLANETVTLEASQNFQNLYIGKPSYVLSFVNKEQAIPGSTLATEIINLTNTGTNRSYVFTDMVGDSVSLYLAQGVYHLFLHDNATFNTTVNLTANQNYVIFGQQLVTIQQFNSIMNKTYSNTNHFAIIPKNFQQIVATNTFESFVFNMYCANGTAMPPSLVVQFVENSETSLQNSQVSVPVSATELGSELITNFTTPKVSGSFTLFIEGYVSISGVQVSGRFSSVLDVEATINVSNGLLLTIIAPNSGQIQAGVNSNFSLFAYNSSGALLNSSTTLNLISGHYLVVNLYEGKTFLQILPVQVVADGTYIFSMNVSKATNYTVVAEVSSVRIGKTNVSASTFISVTALSYNPVTQPLSSPSFYKSISLFSDYVGIFSFVGVVAYGTYRFIRKRYRKKVGIETGMIYQIDGSAVYDHMTPQQKEQVWANIPNRIREDVINNVLYPVSYKDGFKYVVSSKEMKKILDDRDQGVKGKK